MKTSKLFTELTNTSWKATRLKPEFAHNLEHFPPCYCQKSRPRLKISNVPVMLQWSALPFVEISKLQFWYYFTGMKGTTTTTWFLHCCIIFKTRGSHTVILRTVMEYIGPLNVYMDTQPKLNIHKTHICCVFTGNPTFFIRTLKLEKAMQCS